MTTIVIQITDELTRMYADTSMSLGGRHVYNSDKIFKLADKHYIAFSGSYAYLPNIDSVFSYNPNSLFSELSEQYFEMVKATGNSEALDTSAMSVFLVMEDGRAYQNILGARNPVQLSNGIYAFGSGCEFAQGYFAALSQDLHYSEIEEHHIKAMYKSISTLGYSTGATYTMAEVKR